MHRLSWLAKLFFLLWGTTLSPHLSAQPLAGQEIVPIPQKYTRPSTSTITSPVNRERGMFLNGRPWQVFTALSGVEAVEKPDPLNRKPKGRKLFFLEAFYVLKDSAEYLLLVKDPNLKRGRLSEGAEKIGWVAKTQLLLWQTALGDTWAWKRKNRVLISLPPTGGKKVKFYQTPELKKKAKVLTGPQSYFVYKVDEKLNVALIGKEERFDAQDVGTVMLGWVSRQYLIEKERWVFCEPNWTPEAAAERQDHAKLRVLEDSLKALNYLQTATFEKSAILWEGDPLEDRMAGDWQRFPVVELYPDLIKVAVYWPKKARFRTGFLPRHNLQSELQNVKFSRLVNRLELAELIELMEQLQVRGPLADKRVTLKQEVWQMTRPYMGPEMSMPKLSKMPFSEILQTVFGLPSESELGNHKMSDFTDEDKIPDEVFQAFFSELESKIETLDRIFNSDDYAYSYRTQSLTYYWIEADLLP